MFHGYVGFLFVDLGSTYDNLMLLLAKVIPSQRFFLMPSMTLTEQKQMVCSWLVLFHAPNGRVVVVNKRWNVF